MNSTDGASEPAAQTENPPLEQAKPANQALKQATPDGESSDQTNSNDQVPEQVNTRGLTALENPVQLTQPNLESAYGQASSLLIVNDEQLPGFHHDYVKRLGRNSMAPGLRVETRPRWGPNTERVLAVKLMVRDGNMSYPFAFFDINMSKLVETVHTQVLELSNEEIDRLITAGNASSPTSLKPLIRKIDTGNCSTRFQMTLRSLNTFSRRPPRL
jgi:hypothetical protein